MLTAGPLAPYFWTEIVGCAACAVICFVPALRTNTLLVIGSLLAIAGIFCKRVQLLVGGFQLANLDFTRTLTPLSHRLGYRPLHDLRGADLLAHADRVRCDLGRHGPRRHLLPGVPFCARQVPALRP